MAEASTATKAADDCDWMFCPISGQLLTFDPARGVAFCEASGYTRSLEDFADVVIEKQCNLGEFQKNFQLQPLVATERRREEETRKRATVDEKCPQCGNQGMEFYTMQLRSADEGQTVFYECPQCKYKYSQNN